MAAVGGALDELTKIYNWEQRGSMTPAEISELMTVIVNRWYTENCGAPVEAETPYWDDAADVDDAMPADSQIWYGMVADVTAPPSGLTFTDELGIWILTGLVALTATPAAAIAFRTFAPKFVLAFKGDDVGEQIRVVVDGVDDLTFDTTGREGELINIPIVPSNQSLSTHDILIMKVN